jgi:hypothetical protein
MEAAMPYKWNPKANRYQWFNGSAYFVPKTQVMAWVDQSLAATGVSTDTLAELLSSGSLSPTDWKARMQLHIKDEYTRQYITGIGGRQNMTPSDWGRVGRMLRDQYGYLDGFAKDVATKNLTEGQIKARARMYVNSARQAYEKANGIVAKKWGADEVYWSLDSSVENCGDCVGFNSLGWQLVDSDPYQGAEPGSGATVCLTNCHCSKIYRNGDTGQEF